MIRCRSRGTKRCLGHAFVPRDDLLPPARDETLLRQRRASPPAIVNLPSLDAQVEIPGEGADPPEAAALSA
jgi:hypothetical protein